MVSDKREFPPGDVDTDQGNCCLRLGLSWILLVPLMLLSCQPKSSNQEEAFIKHTNTGKNYYDRGEADKAVNALEQALALNPAHPDAHLNLANAYLLANKPDVALQQARAVLKTEPSSAPALYVAGCAQLRLGQPKEAVQMLQQAKEIDRTINAVSYQLARAYQQAGDYEAAAQELTELLQFEPEHPAAHYTYSQVLMRLGRNDEAGQELAAHQKITGGKSAQMGPSTFERSAYTQIRLPFKLEQPDPKGIQVIFADATAAAFGGKAKQYSGPVGVLDLRNDGFNSLFVVEGAGFRFLLNSNGIFHPQENLLPGLPGGKYSHCLVGDLNNDRVEDAIMLGDKGSQVFKFSTNAGMTDISRFSRLADVTAADGLLVDLDFTAKLDLVAVTPNTNKVRVLRNLGTPYFSENTTNSGVPLDLTGVRDVLVEDWNNDEVQDLLIAREGQPPLLLVKQRGGALAPTNATVNWPTAHALAAGDLNNDLRADLVLAGADQLTCIFNGLDQRQTIALGGWHASAVRTLDYDNDGWLDIVAIGEGLRVWRNLGSTGFKEMTPALGLDRLGKARLASLAAADLDRDGDTDLLLAFEGGGLQLLRNDGGNAHAQLKVNLIGNKSNASGLGIRLEVAAGGLRLSRRVNQLPVEIGLGQHWQVESLTAHWFDVNLNYADVKVDPATLLPVEELTLPTGSCPYFYAWDGRQFRFVTDILGAAPVGLRISDHRFVDADPFEYVWIGDEAMFPPKDQEHLLAITSELREVIYLDEAKLVVVDHPAGTEVHTTSKMVPGRPFPKHELVTLDHRRPLVHASNDQGDDVTELLRDTDQKLVSPARLRIPQLRGLAEPYGVTMDFGLLPADRPLVLALTGWLRFGGGMVNVAASHHPDLPFPFPVLEVENAQGAWQAIDVTVGVPAGKTKTILVDLAGKLPPASRRLRLRTAYEIHWDRVALFERRDSPATQITRLTPTKTDLHWHGYGEYENLPWNFPLTPKHAQVSMTAKWTITPSGWCTRYGEVGELVAQADNAFALINGGDELTLHFAKGRLPAKPAGAERDFFLYTAGWEKDSDFHVELGWQVEPLPWHGMDDQRYGQEQRPAFPAADALMTKYNTRWVGPYTLARKR